MSSSNIAQLSCPLPINDHPYVLLSHGSGGRMSHQIIDNLFKVAFSDVHAHDGATLHIKNNKTVLTTDSYVVQPLFFSGGDIGSLSINGTVNDLAMCGAKPLYLSCSFILEEGFPIKDLWTIAQSMKLTADQSNIKIVTGDTKVVEKNKGDGVYINTTGVGIIEHNLDISAGTIKPDDTILISSSVGRHGMAIMARRNNLEFTPEISSDCRPLHNHVLSLINAGIKVKCLRDATRGGLASTLNELALEASVHIQCEQNAIPVDESVSNACEILGIDPYHVANEGCFIAFIDKKDTSKALDILKGYNQDAALIGHVKEKREGVVTLITSVGGERVIDIPSGELLPRIC